MDTDSTSNDQPANPKTKRRWFTPRIIIFLALVCFPVFYFINKPFLADYFGRATLPYADYEPQVNLWLTLIEMVVLVFIFWLVKRRFQFGLSTLLIIVTLSAVACSWFTVKMQKAKEQREAVEAIWKWDTNVTSFGKIQTATRGQVGSIPYQGDFVIIVYDWQVGTSERRTKSPIPTWLRNLVGDDFFYNVHSLYVDQADLTESDLTPLKILTEIKFIYLANCKINDNGLEPLKDLHKLRMLSLHNSNITDTGLKCLEGVDQLQTLFLDVTKISDTGLASLKGMTHLNIFGSQQHKYYWFWIETSQRIKPTQLVKSQ